MPVCVFIIYKKTERNKRAHVSFLDLGTSEAGVTVVARFTFSRTSTLIRATANK